jgi:hypothetical protein
MRLRRGVRATMRRTIQAIAISLGLTACAAPTQPGANGYEDARFTQLDDLNCREQASAATTRTYEVFGYQGHDDLAINAYKSTFDRCMLGR